MAAGARETLARLFDTTHANIAWAIRNGPEYPNDFDTTQISQHLTPFFTSIEHGFQTVYNEAGEAQRKINALEPRIQQYEQQALTYAETIQTLTKALTNTNPSPTKPQKKKREAKDPTPFDGKGSPTERQEKFEIWETKIQGVFERDAACFETPMEEILYMSDMLTDKAYDYIKHGLDVRRRHPDDPSKWIFFNRETMLKYMRTHYKTINTAQVARNKLDTLRQGERNYWSWKAELDELTTKANKTEEQKVELLKKNVSPKMKDLVLNLSTEIDDNDYTAWSKQMDIFARNIQNHAHQTKLDTTNSYRPTNSNTPAPTPTDDPMDLDAARLVGLSNDIRKQRMDNRLCLACGQPGHWKDAHDPKKNPNPLPMPPRQPPPNRGGFFSRGDNYQSSNHRRGRGFHYGGPPTRFPPRYSPKR